MFYVDYRNGIMNSSSCFSLIATQLETELNARSLKKKGVQMPNIAVNSPDQAKCNKIKNKKKLK